MRKPEKTFVVTGLMLSVVLSSGCGTYAGYYMPEAYSEELPASEAELNMRGASSTPAVTASMLLAKTGGPSDDARVTAQPPGPRLIVYSGALQMVVIQIFQTLDKINSIARSLGGYVHLLEENTVTIKVPVDKFEEAMDTISRLGEVTGKAFKSSDITDTVRDFRIRLANAENVRDRLVKLLDKCTTVEDTLKVEKELGRITEEIELLKGRLQQMEHSVAFSTITVVLNSPIPQARTRQRSPFNWVNFLGSGIETGLNAYPSKGRPIVNFQLPESYVLFRRGNNSAAISADGVSLLIQRQENYEGGNLDFWSGLIRKQLVAHRCIAINEESDLQLATKVPAKLFAGVKAVAGEDVGYTVAVAVNRSFVYVFEAWGPAAVLSKDKRKIEESVKSLRVPR